MIYSRWDPTTGTYDYFEGSSDVEVGLNDDLPIPALPSGTAIGVPSTECGRPIPAGAVHVGNGEFATGVIAPPAGARLHGANGLARALGSADFWMGLGLGGVLMVGWFWLEHRWKRRRGAR